MVAKRLIGRKPRIAPERLADLSLPLGNLISSNEQQPSEVT